MLTWIKADIEAGVADNPRTKQPGRDRLSIEAASDKTAATAAEWI
jgi:hypothetical protein